MKAANLLSTLGKGGISKRLQQHGLYANLELFPGRQCRHPLQRVVELAQFKDKYDSGEIGYFFIPEVAGAENNGPNTSITAGLAYAFNKETFDAETKRFFKFVVEHYNQAAFDVGGYLSPMNGDLPSNVFKLAKDFSLDLEAVAKGGVSWDDKLDPASNEVVGSTANELALGLITPEEFAEKVDKAIGRNAPSFFKDQK
ncbi:hypothetical protein [Cohnella faecalis]|uniref:hypothetical protein n=1 Tax=Cohnella faecalis TaxID=2315694 RepID=UPI0011C23D4A|nr:hypothetical protein [Cohnella faecalis]